MFIKSAYHLLVALVLAGVLMATVAAGPGTSITGGGSATDMTRFGLGVSNGTGHFECLMPAVMTVEGTVLGVDAATTQTATFHGVAQVTLSAGNPFGLKAGPMARNQAFIANVRAGGPNQGLVDLEIMGMSFVGIVTHGQVRISTG